MQRRNKTTATQPTKAKEPIHDEHDHDHGHDHSHSHGGIFHSHSHDHGQGSAEALVKVLKGEGVDRGTKVTVIGLFTNVGLTAVKGAAGWYFHSAALLAEAGHSLSDLLADFVTLICWRTSRKPPSDSYPYGFGKFESFGTATVSLLLIGGALAIGYHSYYTFIQVLAPTISSLPPGALQDILQTFISSNMTALDAASQVVPHSHAHSHSFGHSHMPHLGEGEVPTLDPNAAWFALASVITKEWVYRLTKKVADEEKSPVLDANAQHHRSDAYSSAVALVAILGSWAIPGLPLDSIGGTLISLLILQQGVSLLAQAIRDLTDAGVPEATRRSLAKTLTPLISSPSSSISPATHSPTAQAILGIRNVRAIKSGSLMFVDLTVDVSPSMTMAEAHSVEEVVRRKIMEERSEVKEVRVHLHALEVEEFKSREHVPKVVAGVGSSGDNRKDIWNDGPC